MTHLTEKLKKDYLPKLIQEFGFICYQCKNTPQNYIFEHLNDKRLDSRYENIALACQSCNIKKIENYDMKIKAEELLKKREETGFKYLENVSALEEISTERQANKILFKFTEQFIEERINTDGKYNLKDAISEIPYVAQKRFGIGAENTIRRYLKQLTCQSAPCQIVRDDNGNDWICRRILN